MKTIRRKHHYTLVEILTVIVIATILFGIGIPAFSTMIRGSNMTIAIRQLSAKIQAARAYAVTNRCKVAVLMVTALAGTNDENKYSAYRVCVVNDSNVWQSWIEDENWTALPKGIIRASQPAEEVASVPVDSISTETTKNVNALIFEKSGQLTATGNVTINLRQGRCLSGTADPVYTERNGAGKIINHPIEITKYTGKVKVKEPEPES